MKKQNIIKQLLLGLAMLLVTKGNAQFQITPATNSEFMGTANIIRGVGIGNFPSGVITSAALHINTKYMSTSSNYPGINFGEVFRTDAPNAATYWKMYRNGNEIGRYWNGGTNNELNIGTIQTGTNPHLNFYTSNTQRMTILGSTNPGFVGIANTAPPFMLSLGTSGSTPDGGILSLGTIGSGVTLPGSLTSARLIWYTKKGAFRAGLASTEWDDSNIGLYSAAFGWYTKASGQASLASGQSSIASGDNSVALGGTTSATANCSVALGHLSEANAYATSAIGWHAIANEARGVAIGSYVRVPANSDASIIIGSGDLPNFCFMNNTIAQSLMVGFNSDVPTFFVGPAPTASGSCGSSHFTGNVGIATTSPAEKLTVNGNIRLENFSIAIYFNNQRFLASEGGSYTSNIYLGIGAGPAGLNTNTSYGDICIGNNAGNSLNVNDGENVLVGNNAGAAVSGANRNTFIGHAAGQTVGIFGASGDLNTFIGNYAGGNNTDIAGSQNNIAIGSNSFAGGEGDDNILIGTETGIYGAHHFVSVAIGQGASIEGDFSVALGEYSTVQSDRTIVLGNYLASTLIGYTAIPPGTILGTDTAARLSVNNLGYGTRAGYFNGTVASTTGFYGPSDINLKKNIEPFTDASSIIDQLKPKTFTFDKVNHPGLNLSKGLQYGLIAQDVERVLPGLVETEYSPPILDSLGNTIIPSESFKAVNYIGLIPILLGELKQQKERIDQLDSLIHVCCGTSSMRLSNPAIKVELLNSIILNQNDPNPFAEETKITYNIPDGVSEAKIIFFDNLGHILQTVKINERGDGQLNVYASNLTSGIYSYSLIADGNVIDTKKMVCTK